LLRRGLVVFQFVIAITLVCGMILIQKQLSFIQEKNLGFNSSHKIVLPLRTETAQKNFISLQNELAKFPSVNGVTAANYIPGSQIWTDFHVYTEGGSMDKGIHFRNNWVEPNYLNVLGIKILAGRNFTENRKSDSAKVVINRKGVKSLGLTLETAIGAPLYFEWQGKKFRFEIIGVMEDYHQVSLKEEIYPLLFRVNTQPNHDFAVADIDSKNISSTLTAVEDTWKSVNADTPFEYSFLDDDIQKQYEEDRKVSGVISAFTIIAMIISCLGLYGLSTYMAERRFKEIGVRKVLGANVGQIVVMMSGEFMKLVLIAFVIATPLSWYCITRWLEGFAYKTTPDVSVFLLSGFGALLIALFTISFESIKAASGNPVTALRNE
jgi:putative ABC transport system permease protein